MNILYQYSALFLVITSIIALLIASPVIEQLLVPAKTESLTELSIFGPNYNTSYPFNIESGYIYPFYLTINNHLGYSANYVLTIKLRSQTESAPNSFLKTPSDLPALCNFTYLIPDKASREEQLNISFNYQTNYPSKQVTLDDITINNYSIDLKSKIILLDTQKNTYFSNLIFELWIFNNTINNFQYHQRYLSLWFNMTN